MADNSSPTPSTTSGALKATDLGASPTPGDRNLRGRVDRLRILSSIFADQSRKTGADQAYDQKVSQSLGQLAEDLENGRRS